MKYAFSLLFISLLFINCKSQKLVSNAGETPSNKREEFPVLKDSSIVITFEQTGCYGTCPVQNLKFSKMDLLHTMVSGIPVW